MASILPLTRAMCDKPPLQRATMDGSGECIAAIALGRKKTGARGNSRPLG